jgi:anti-sigma B factor antagonist
MNSVLAIRSETQGDRGLTKLKLSGRLDASTVSQLERALADAQLAGAHTLVIDMSDLTYVSSSGLRVLLSARSAIRKRNGDIFLCALGRNVREVFDMVGFSAVFSIFDTQEQAIQAADKLAGR